MTNEEKMRDSLLRYLEGHESLEELKLSHSIAECQNPNCDNKNVPSDYGREIEAYGGFICRDCLNNGYGR
jgi:hypothetical protein